MKLYSVHIVWKYPGLLWTHPHLHLLCDGLQLRSPDVHLNPTVKMEILVWLVRKVLTGKCWSEDKRRQLSLGSQHVACQKGKKAQLVL